MSDEYPVIVPPGGGGGAPLGPGAMVANTLQGILAQRRAKTQQDLINKLTQDQQTAQITHLQNEDAYNRDAREALAESRRQTAADRKAHQEQMANNSGYAWDHAYDTEDPILQDAMIAKAQNPEKAESLDAIILNRRMALEAQKEKEQYEDETYMDDVTKKAGYIMVPDPKDPTKMIRHQVKKGSATHHIPRTAELAPPGKVPTLKQEGVDPKGNNVFSMPGNVDPTTHLPLLYTSDPNGAGLVTYTGPVLRPTGVGAKANFQIPPSVEAKIQAYIHGGQLGKRNVTSAFTHPGTIWGTNKGDPASLKAWKDESTAAINNFKSQLPGHVSQAAQDIINSAEQWEDYGSDQVADAKLGSTGSPEDKELLTKVLKLVRGK